jgi:riboflavin biosynthesis pyrimidine reductase
MRELYGGDLIFTDPPTARPLIVANFVQTIDGIVSLKIPGRAGGGEISGRNEEDTFIMGLLRSFADAVMIGEETFRNGAGHLWTPGFIYPPMEKEFLALRKHLRKASPHPMTIIVSGLGEVNLTERLFQRDDIQSIVLTTRRGEARLKRRYGKQLPATIEVLPGEGLIDPSDMVGLLGARSGVKLLLHEGGPMLFSGFLSTLLLDELFVTVAPQIVGQGALGERPPFSDHLARDADQGLWATLLSVKHAGATGHVFLRYRLSARR